MKKERQKHEEQFSYRKWLLSIEICAAGGAVTGAVGTAVVGGADVGLMAAGGFVGGAAWGAIDYPLKHILKEKKKPN